MMVVQEFRGALRRLLKRPGYALLSVTVLGVGLGVTLFLFSLVNTLILKPLPFPDAERLMAVGERSSSGHGIDSLDSAQYELLRRSLQAADAVGAYTAGGVSLDDGQGAVYFPGSRSSASLLEMLGVRPLLGRLFTAADEQPGAEHVLLIGEPLWRTTFAADPHVVGRQIRVNGEWATVVGVLPASFSFPQYTRVWRPLRLLPGQHRDLAGVLRLAPGKTLGQARAELDAIQPALQRVLPTDMHMRAVVTKPLGYSFVPEDMRYWVWLMFGAGTLVLLLACVNVANLQLVQAVRRAHELALRHALGSARGRLVFGAMAEGWLLGMAGWLLALPIVQWGNRWLVAVYFRPGRMPGFHHFGLDGWVLAAGALMAIATTTLVGAVPAWRAARCDPQQALRDGAKGSGSGFARVARVMVVAEIVLTVVLLVGAGMFVGAVQRLLARPTPGIGYAAQVLTAELALPRQSYDDARRIAVIGEAVARLRATPGVVDATAADTVPGGRLGSHERVGLLGQPRPVSGWTEVQLGVVDPHFLSTFGVRLLAGRFFDARDTAGGQTVAVVDRHLAQALWPGQDPLQRQLTLHPGTAWARSLTVIGVTEPLQMDGLLERSVPGLLMPVSQAAGQAPLHAVGLAVRTHGAAAAFIPNLTGIVHGVDSQVAVHDVLSQQWIMARSQAGLTVMANVFGVLGLVALGLAATGLYGVVAFSVEQRTREIGIRRAIGGGGWAIARLLGRQLAWQLGLGLVLGILLALPWSRLLADPNLQTRAHDPTVFGSVIVLVVATALVATLLPLRRALQVDPAVALRYE